MPEKQSPRPKHPARPKWGVRLDPYHQFVVEQLMDAFGADQASVLERIVVQWVNEHSTDQVREAGASIKDWKAVRGQRGDVTP